MPPSVLLTGASGFIGQRLLPRLRQAMPEAIIHAVGGRDSHSAAYDGVHSVNLDLNDRQGIQDLARSTRPDVVLHLAAQSSVASSLSSPWSGWRTNLFGTLELAEAVKEVRPDATLLFASTAEVYGRAFSSEETLTEDSPLAPANPYARSKAACEYALQDLWDKDGRLIALRIFNHIGPGQDERFVASAFAAQIARIEHGLLPPVIKVGDLTVERDFGDVDDLIDAFVAVLSVRNGLPARSTFNVCAGHPAPVQGLLDGLISLSSATPRIEIDADRLRPGELRRVSGSNAALKAATGWTPRRQLPETLEKLLTYWRGVVAQQV
ncbi:NAD(P)-dependent oxidoreductase [Brevundimonas sp.]|uniref:NAD-dependent epimerase/dehydratase family protein n=1 Tax=Brevundimonas sp. TaxID=1871086 RepID=UPI001A27FA37|nr:NAD-dependent epimerase/dehydratase family protein [Brevundimonas sp.]MBJ7483569.1 GDP-mannose 4,6-dehydratase [Brevundimonas sp.]